MSSLSPKSLKRLNTVKKAVMDTVHINIFDSLFNTLLIGGLIVVAIVIGFGIYHSIREKKHRQMEAEGGAHIEHYDNMVDEDKKNMMIF